ncbi:hypothetical protein [Lysinibacillus sphaericus]|uniref:hypothetical protein n=1 Tax=Lysinibacillus sphaericus TaxID=1421 RepID=UPI0018CF35FA|nr:hypothetical protein [Lysinibacillus sphaericus]MBG9479401.1 hypothetical protein [Lysinibacillus sphaericus]MBG9479452.1 hypothetical protein [Lysinibacillus sphaericus]
MNEVDREIKDAAITSGQQISMRVEEVADALINIAETYGASVTQLKEALMIFARTTNDLTMSPEEVATMVNCIEPRRQETKLIYKMCFNRPRIVHQVSNRKPRNLIKKIIH